MTYFMTSSFVKFVFADSQPSCIQMWESCAREWQKI